MKILLIKPGIFENDSKDLMSNSSTMPPLGLLYLGAVLEKEDHNVEILDFCMEKISEVKLKNALMSTEAVGMTIYSDDNFNPHNNITNKIKEIDPDIPIIIGGPHCTFVKQQSLNDISKADICVIGEGERVILDIAKSIQGEKKLADIHGIYYKENGSVFPGKPLDIIKNLDDLPFPARHLVEKYDYSNFSFGYSFKGKVANMITSKGCPFQCRFCSRYGNIIKDWGFRNRSAENVVNEIIEISEKYKSVVIVDDNFLANKKRANNIFDMLLKTNLDIEFLIEGTRIDTADRELYLKMKKAGVKYIFYGLESGNQDVLDFYNKNITLKQIKKTVSLAREMDFFIGASFIFGAPMETKKHIENTIKFACSLPLDRVSFVPLIYRMGSSLWTEAVKNKKIKPDQYEVLADSNHNLSNFTADELIQYTSNAFTTFYFRPGYIFKQTLKTLIRKDYKFIKYGIKYFISFNKAKEEGVEIIKSKNI